MDAYQTELKVMDGRLFRVALHYDYCTGEPWVEHDGHGEVSDWERRSKRPGEMVLVEDRGSRLFYDFAGAVRKARAEGWNKAPYTWRTKREQAAAAALADFKRMRAWCNDEWHWCWMEVTLLDGYGEATDISSSLGGLESDGGEYLDETARELMADCLRQLEARTYPVTAMVV